jgi:hypothetical protein
MWRSKKFIVIAAVIVLVIVASTAGIVYAQTDKGTDTPGKTLFARVSQILGIDQQKLEDAFAKAQGDINNEALDSYLQKQVTNGKMTQEQADQYKTWWQARPDTPLPGPFKWFGGRHFPGGGMRGWGSGFRPLPGGLPPTPTQ